MRILNIDDSKQGTVEDVLSTQYTVHYDDGTFGFLFKKNRGLTWKEIDDDTRNSE